ncbi:MAG: site-2 protease family protein, partial [Dehalococcoidia bacterium]|nr:site-2 protease family protein [Dehalococcoidia bacterium]
FKFTPKNSPTTFQIGALPFFAFVQIAGMNPLEDVDPNDRGSDANAKLFARIVTIFAGSFFNYLFACVFLFVSLLIAGDIESRIDPLPGSVAEAAGFRSGDLVVVVWAAVMLLPGVLSDDNNPNTARLVSMIPVAFLIPARGLEVLLHLAGRAAPRPLVGAAAGAVVLVTFLRTSDALTTWATAPEAFAARSGEAVDAVLAMNARASEPGAVFVLPISNAWPESRRYQQRSIQFLYRGPAPYAFVRIDDVTTPAALDALCNGCATMYLFVWHKGPHIDADPKELAPTLALAAGLPTVAEPRRGVDLLGFRFPEAPQFDHAPPLPMELTFGDRLRLVGARATPTWSGRDVFVLTAWRAGPRPGAERLSLRVLDPDGRVIGQLDKTLLNNAHLPPPRWRRDETVVDRAVVPLPPGTPPDDYRAQVVVYGGGPPESAELGIVTVPVARAPYGPDDLDLDAEAMVSTGPARLLGFAVAGEARANQPLAVTLYWRAEAAPLPDVDATLVLARGDGEIAAATPGVAGGRRPASRWRVGELVAETRTIQPAAPGVYDLAVIVADRVVASNRITVAP